MARDSYRARSAPRSLALTAMLTRCQVAMPSATFRARSAPRSLALTAMLTRCQVAMMLSPETATATVFRPVGAGPEMWAPVLGSNVEPWQGHAKLDATVQPTVTEESAAMTVPPLVAPTAELLPDPVAADEVEVPELAPAPVPDELVEAPDALFGSGAWLQAASATTDTPVAPTARTERRLTPFLADSVLSSESVSSLRGIFKISDLRGGASLLPTVPSLLRFSRHMSHASLCSTSRLAFDTQ
jgi:hypothetical protein